jgi:hypothetical protein
MKAAERSLYLALIAILALLLLLARSCGRPKPCPDLSAQTIIKRDTVFVTTSDTLYGKRLVPIAIIRDTSHTRPLTSQPSRPISNAYSQRLDTTTAGISYVSYVYRDTIHVPFGSVYVIDTVTNNQPVRTTITDIQMPVVTTQSQLKPRNQVYVGLDVIGTLHSPVSFVGPQLLLKNKRDQIYTAGVLVNQVKQFTPDKLTFKVGAYYKIRLKRNQ